MATKKEELEKAARGEGCLGKAADNEPVFILRAQDKLAPYVVRRWAGRAEMELGVDHPKVVEAYALADRMEKWPTRKFPD